MVRRPARSVEQGLPTVPGSNPRMLQKSLASPADCIAYDLEDAVAPNAKAEARRLVRDLLNVCISASR